MTTATSSSSSNSHHPAVLKQSAIINSRLRRTEYAVRGELYLAAQARKEAGKEVIMTNVGNPQALGQRPVTFFRQVMALLVAPLETAKEMARLLRFPSDVVRRADAYRAMLAGGSVGAYTDSRGVPGVRSEVAAFISQRDGYPARPDDVYVTNGASAAVCRVFTALLRDTSDAVLVPRPQYPLYSASVTLHGGTMVSYALDEEAGWQTNVEQLRAAVSSARDKGMSVRAMVVINPGNPTGQCASRETLREVVRFCADNNILLMADEVYQANIYQREQPFYSLFRTAYDLGSGVADRLELVSFHSSSKGALGECGLRGGYMHLHNCSAVFHREIYKLLSVSLSPNVLGNVAVGLMVNPPRPGDESYARYAQEIRATIESLTRRARAMTDAFNSCEGVTCTFTEGAMYSFPQIRLPPAAAAAAKAANKEPDVFYCLRLLDATGISVVPGSGFGQAEGSFHFRTTILPPEDDFPRILGLFTKFHAEFMAKYSQDGSTRSRL
eukprot:UC1_evm2s995